MFNGKSFSLSATYQKQKNSLREYFITQEQGITHVGLFEADKIKKLSLSSRYSQTLFPLKYPVKLDMGISYETISAPSFIIKTPVKQKIRNLIPKLNVSTLTSNFFNFKLESSLTLQENKTPQSDYPGIFFRNELSMQMRNKKWNGTLSFVYDQNRINHKKYDRKNINFNIDYTKGKITLSLNARHLGEMLSLFRNDAYNIRLQTNNGLISRTVYNQSLSYIIFGIKVNI